MDKVYTLAAAPRFKDEDEVLLTYNVLLAKMSKMAKLFDKHHLEWEEEECLATDKQGNCLEMAGTLTGKYKDALAFLKGAHPGEKLRELDSYITKV